MMTIVKNIVLAFTLVGIINLIACGGKDTPAPIVDPTQEIIDALTKTWSVTSVQLDNADVTGDWSSFTLTFDNSKGYSATVLNAESILVWPANGSYSFPNASNANQVLRNDGVEITLSNVTKTSATLTFNILGRNGRIDGLIGEWVFEMGS